MRYFPAAVLLLATGAAPARAEFSEEWQTLAAEIEAGCDAAEAALPSGGATPEPAEALYMPDRLRGPFRPHMCVIVQFSLDDSGAAQKVERVYRGPENLNYQFVRRTQAAVKKWRFNLDGASGAGFQKLFARMDFIPLGDWRYAIRYRYWNGGEPAGGGE